MSHDIDLHAFVVKASSTFTELKKALDLLPSATCEQIVHAVQDKLATAEKQKPIIEDLEDSIKTLTEIETCLSEAKLGLEEENTEDAVKQLIDIAQDARKAKNTLNELVLLNPDSFTLSDVAKAAAKRIRELEAPLLRVNGETAKHVRLLMGA